MPSENEAAEITGRVIDSFGGIRPMATKLSVPVTTVQGWKKRGIIPQGRHADILAAANREGIALDPAELAATDTGVGTRTDTRAADPVSEARSDFAVPPASAAPSTVIVRRGGAAAYAALVFSILVAAGVVAAGYGAWQFYLQPLKVKVAALEARPGGAASDELVRRVAKLESDIAQSASTLASAPTPGVQASGGTGGDADQLAALESQVAELKAGSAHTEQLAKSLSDLQVAAGGRELLVQSIRDIQSSTAATQGEVERLSSQVAAFGGRLDQVDAAVADKRQQALRAEAIVLAVGQLRAKLATSKPFAKEIGVLRAMVGGDADMVAALDQIQPFADAGVPSVDDLAKDFARMAPVLVRSAVVGDGQSWWRQALYHVETVISIRRVGENTAGDSTDAIVARAEGKVDDGDLPGAVSALQALSTLPAQMASSWIGDAQHRIAADAAETELTRIAIGHVATGNAPAAPAPAAPVSTPGSK
ncbi:MAG: hypothetical protein JWM91_4078 [Rhodospirillales bacterium]|nr:hypothetical protein [Rhodospirillales bacterium]